MIASWFRTAGAPTSPSPSPQSEPAQRGRASFRAALLAGALLAGLAPAVAQAQDVLISNIGQSGGVSTRAVGPSGSNQFSQAQQFTTGANTNGYALSEVDGAIANFPTTAMSTVSICNSSSGSPGSTCTTLTNPASVVSQRTNTWTAPANTVLLANTDYFVVFEGSGTTSQVRGIQSNNEDAGGAEGWSIADSSRWRNSDSGSWSTNPSSLKIAIKGTAATGTDTTSPALSTTTPPTVNGSTLTLTYDEALNTTAPAAGAFSVSVDGGAGAAPNAVSISGSAVTLTLASAVTGGQTVTVTYTKPTTNPIQDTSGNEAAALTNQAVTNVTPGVKLTPTALTVAEGGSGTYTVALTARPTGEVTVAISSDNDDVDIEDTDGDTALIQRFLVFTTSDWSTAQTVTVNAAEDPNADPDTATLTHGLSGASEYNSLADPTLEVTVEENDKLPGAPSISSVTAGAAQLTVVWSAPVDPGYSDGTEGSHTDNTVTGYDVRHILSSATDKSDSQWTEVLDAWTSGALEYAIASLTADASYDVQVRAVTEVGEGPWSGTSTGTPLAVPLGIAYAGGFTEAAANDGSVTGSVTATLSGDTFTSDVVSDNHVTASNVPSGLTASFARTSDTVVTLTLTGNANAHANSNDVSNLTVTFADGAFEDETASTVSGSTKSDLGIDFTDASTLTYVGSFSEAGANDGSVTSSVTATLSGDTFASDVTDHVTASNMPSGLSASFFRNSDTLVTLTLTGSAAAHADAGSFTEAAANDGSVAGSVTATLTGDTFTSDVVSADRVTASNVPSGLIASFARTSDTVVTLTLTGRAANHANTNDVSNLTVTFSNGAFTNETAATVGESTKSDLAIDFRDASSIAYAGNFAEASGNDGSITGSVTATLTGDTFTSDVVSAPHVTATNVPAGLTASFERTSNTVVTLTLTGNAGAHADGDDVDDLTVTFADGAFTAETAATVGGSTKSDLAIDFADAAMEPYVPRDFRAQPLSNGIRYRWEAPSAGGQTGYDIRYSTDASFPEASTTVFEAEAHVVTIVQRGMTAGTAQFSQIRAKDAGGSPGPWSYTLKATPNAPASNRMPPDAPAAPTVTAGDGSLAVTWTAPDDRGNTITDYHVRHIRTDATDKSDDDAWTSAGGAEWRIGRDTALSYTITGLENGVSYDVQVQATTGNGKGDWSPTTAGTPMAADTPMDTTAPALSTTAPPAVNGATLTLTYDETLDGDSEPGNDAFTVEVNGAEVSLAAGDAAVSGTTVTLTLAAAVPAGATVEVSYTKPTGAGAEPIQDAAGNPAADLTDEPVTNVTPGVTLSVGSLTVDEGGSGTYTVVLTAKPTANVTVTVSSDNDDVTVDVDANMDDDQDKLTFKPTDWNVARTVTVTADDDPDAMDGNAILTHTIAGASEYDALADPTLPVRVDDDEAPVATGVAYAGSFTEAAANDGSVTGSVTATLTGDTFTSDAVDHVSASNVPGGLTASFARTSNTVVTLTLTGRAANHANSNDVSNLTVTFADGAFTTGTASTVSGSTKSDLAIDFTDASTLTYAGSFTEAAANDGSVTGSVTATLAGDTFTSDVVSANRVTASNVPSGLTASFARTSDTVVTLTLTGNADDHENSDDVSDLTVTFADAAFTDEAAATIAGSTKSDLAIDFADASTLTYAGSFTEAAANDGSVTGSVTATLAGDTFTGDVVSANRVTASNVPAGLTASFARTSDTVVTLTLTGNADDHESSDDVSDLTVTFADAAFTNEAAATIAGSTKSDLAIDFTDASTLTYAGSFAEAAANDGSVTGSVTATLAGDTFTSDVVSASRVTASNVPSGLTASFARTSDTVVTLTLTGNADDHESNDVGDLTVTFTDAAFANEGASTIGGSTKNDLAIDFTGASTLTYAGSFAEAAANDGSVTGSVTATLSGDTFTSGVVSGNHVTATNVPAGLTASFARTSDTVVTLTLTGNADDHENSDDVSDLTVTFADAAFTNEAAATVSGSTKNDLGVDFRDASSIAYAGGFVEAAANDGSVTGSVRATLSGDTFASDVVSGNHVTASNVPSGLTASFARTSDTVVTLTLTGNADAHANADDVSDLTVTFADAAFANEAAATVGGTTRNDLSIDFTDASTLTYAGSFAESAANDGSVTGSVTATLSGDTFTSGVVSGNHVTATNVPAGLTASFARTSSTVVTLTLTGNADDHESSDDVSDLTIAFADAAFTNEAAATVSGSTKNDVVVDFRDASGIAYAGSFAEAAANDGSVTGSVTATLTGDTFTSDVVSVDHVSASNVPAGLAASFARTSGTVVTLTLTGNADDHENSDDVGDLTIAFADAAFTNEAAATIAGATKNDLAVDFRDASSIAYAGGFTEAATNDGSVTGSVTATLAGDTFASDVVSGNHVTASNVPSGLTASFARTSGTVVTLTLTGNANAHARANDVDDLTVTFADGAFANEAASRIGGSTRNDLAIDFTDASTLTWAGGFTEAAANDGSVTGSVTATLTGDTFTSGVVSGNHVSASNVPPGLTPSFARTSDTVVTLTLTGNATNHAHAHDVSDLTVAFADGAFTNESAATVGGSTRGGFAIDFADPDTPTVAGWSCRAARTAATPTGPARRSGWR